MTPPPKPARGPDPAAMRGADEFAVLTAESVRNVRESAEHWRTGMAALFTLVTTTLLLKGPEKAADLPVGWRLTLTILLGLGLALAIAALWRARRRPPASPASCGWPTSAPATAPSPRSAWPRRSAPPSSSHTPAGSSSRPCACWWPTCSPGGGRPRTPPSR